MRLRDPARQVCPTRLKDLCFDPRRGNHIRPTSRSPESSESSGYSAQCCRPHPETVDDCEHREHDGGEISVWNRKICQFDKIPCERNRHCSHAACLNHEQQYPAIKKCDRRMKRFSQVSVLTADVRSQSSQFSPDECGGECKEAAKHPGAENQERSVNLKRDHRRIHKDPRADNAAHHDHGGIKEAESSG